MLASIEHVYLTGYIRVTTEYNPESPLKDYNDEYPDEEDPIPALKKSTNGKEAIISEDKEIKKLALREKLAQNGFAL